MSLRHGLDKVSGPLPVSLSTAMEDVVSNEILFDDGTAVVLDIALYHLFQSDMPERTHSVRLRGRLRTRESLEGLRSAVPPNRSGQQPPN